MKIKVIGCGGAFTEELYHQCFMLSENGRNLFIDYGQQIQPFALKNAGLTVKDVDEVIITHCHDDHVLSLGMLGLRRYDFINKPQNCKDTKIPYAPKLIINHNLLSEINDITKGNFRTIEGFVSTLDTFFDVKVLQDNEPYFFEGWKVDMVQQIHVMTGSTVMYSYGVFFEKGDKSFLITSDTQYFQPRQVHYFYKKANLIITDCETIGTNFQFQEGEKVYIKDGKPYRYPVQADDPDGMKSLEIMTKGYEIKDWECFKFMSGVHSSYCELAGYKSANAMILSSDIKDKTWLSHYGDHVIHGVDAFGNKVDWDAQAKKDGFAGFVKLGQVFEV